MNDESEKIDMTLVPQLKLKDKSVFCRSSTECGIWSDDISGKRAGQAKSLVDLVVSQSLSCTICLNAGWGAGKTFFLTRFVEEYKCVMTGDSKVAPTAIYYNAWKDDFFANPLLSIVAQLVETNSLARFHTILDDIKKASVPLLAQIGLNISKVVAKGLVQKFTGMRPDEIKDALNLSLGDIVALSQESLYDSYKEQTQARDFLREKLKELSVANWKDTHRPLVMVVDELDRCRPTFAIELLERIKHLFDVPYLVFVIGMDKEQLEKSLKSVYGDIDAQNYFQKLIDVETTLPQLSTDDFIVSVWKDLGFERLDIPGGSSQPVFGSDDLVFEYYKYLAHINNLTFRQIEQGLRLFFFLARPYAIARTRRITVSPELIAVAIVLKIIDAELYKKVVDWNMPVWEILDAIIPGQTKMDEWSNARKIAAEFYKLACSQNPMGVLRQNLTNYAKDGRAREDSANSDFKLPKCIENLSPVERQRFYNVISDDLKSKSALRTDDGKAYNDQRVQFLDKTRVETLKLIREAFQISRVLAWNR